MQMRSTAPVTPEPGRPAQRTRTGSGPGTVARGHPDGRPALWLRSRRTRWDCCVGGGPALVAALVAANTAPALVTPPPVAVAVGALSLTPGVSIRDVLQNGVSLRTWDQRPRAIAGILCSWVVNPGPAQNRSNWSWPPVGWPDATRARASEPAAGPVQRDRSRWPAGAQDTAAGELEHRPWSREPALLPLNPPAQAGEDRLRPRFRIDDAALAS